LRNADPIGEAKPQWLMTEVFDGFGPHTSLLEAMQIRADSKKYASKKKGIRRIVTQRTPNTLQHKIRLQRKKSLVCCGQLLFFKREYWINGD
jgi:hypothetical protein